MSEYDCFAYHYDALMGTRDECVADLRRLLRRHAPRARTLLEIGCGTGSVLKQLRGKYEIAGVDLSAQMLRMARKKLPGVPLKQMDITKLGGVGTFDVILCVFDTINHLPSFSLWKQVFRRVRAVLNPGGVFIFDINTVYGLEQYSAAPAFAEITRDGICVFEAHAEGNRRYRLDLRLLKKQPSGTYKLYKTTIRELAVPTESVIAAAKEVFRTVRIWDSERTRPSAISEELYFICK